MTTSHALQAFATVFPSELPDKTMVATVILVTRHRRPLAVWIGAGAAFTIHVVFAVLAGGAISLLPRKPVHVLVAALFAFGALTLFRAAWRTDAADTSDLAKADQGDRSSRLVTVIASFGLILVAEWGDLTQVATASLAARSHDPVGTGVGALAALLAVAAIAATFGRQLVARVPLHRINYVGAAVFAGLAVWTIVDLF